jgi:type I restriction enzyme S subunit
MKANAEKALNEAKALFQASLKEMLEPKEGWEEKKLIKEFSLKSGENLSAKNQVIGPYPVYGGNGITGYHYQYNLSGDQILIGRVGALCGNIHYIKERIWVTDNAFVVNNISSSWNMLFLSYELEYINLNQYASQTAQPVISNKSMKDVSIFQPPLSEQQSIVETLDSLKSKVDCLQANFDKISQECDALKQAILRQVFT